MGVVLRNTEVSDSSWIVIEPKDNSSEDGTPIVSVFFCPGEKRHNMTYQPAFEAMEEGGYRIAGFGFRNSLGGTQDRRKQ